MATVTLKAARTAIEARLAAEVTALKFTDIVAGPKQAPRPKAHKGCRVRVDGTRTMWFMPAVNVEHVADDLEVEVLWQVKPHDQDASEDDLNDLEDEIRTALTSSSWAGGVGIRVRGVPGETVREVLEDQGWLRSVLSFEVQRDQALAGAAF